MEDDLKEMLQAYRMRLAMERESRESAIADSRPEDINRAEGAIQVYRKIILDLCELLQGENRSGV
jgi:DNA-binding GntR family transcriptional regulator